jgi:hypothetical protein
MSLLIGLWLPLAPPLRHVSIQPTKKKHFFALDRIQRKVLASCVVAYHSQQVRYAVNRV